MATLHFEILRRIAETASGMRYQDTWFEVTDTEVLIYDHEPTNVPPGSTVIKCTAWQAPPIPPVTAAHITAEGVRHDLLKVAVPEQEMQGWEGPKWLAADAVFWSAAAVEKFLVPYYASTYGSLAPKAVAQLMNVFVPPGSPELEGNAMMELVDAPDAPDFVSNLGTPSVSVTDPPDYDQPFAIVHLPSSEYAAEPPGIETGGSVLPRLFTLHRSGAVKKVRVEV
jgi:hypothetical protein